MRIIIIINIKKREHWYCYSLVLVLAGTEKKPVGTSLVIINNCTKTPQRKRYMKNSSFHHCDGEDGRDQLISSRPLHCRHVRQAGFADNVKAIYFHAVSEGSCVY